MYPQHRRRRPKWLYQGMIYMGMMIIWFALPTTPHLGQKILITTGIITAAISAYWKSETIHHYKRKVK